MALNNFKTREPTLQFLIPQWKQTLDPVVENPIVQGNLITNQKLVNGANSINHGLGRKLQGWIVVRLRAAAFIYDTQDTNNMPNLTLELVSNAAVTVDLYVF